MSLLIAFLKSEQIDNVPSDLREKSYKHNMVFVPVTPSALNQIGGVGRGKKSQPNVKTVTRLLHLAHFCSIQTLAEPKFSTSCQVSFPFPQMFSGPKLEHLKMGKAKLHTDLISHYNNTK